MKKVILMATDEFMYDRFITEFSRFSDIEIHLNTFQNIEGIDCLVSPANSFGLMDGGMDADITEYFGTQLQDRVQDRIKEEFYSEQPVGTSFVIETNNKRIPYLAHTPTMRVPMDVSKTENAYLAMRATLIEVLKHDNINTMAIPAFCQGVGLMHSVDVAYQMSKAYLQVLAQPQEIGWGYANSIDYAIKQYRK